MSGNYAKKDICVYVYRLYIYKYLHPFATRWQNISFQLEILHLEAKNSAKSKTCPSTGVLAHYILKNTYHNITILQFSNILFS